MVEERLKILHSDFKNILNLITVFNYVSIHYYGFYFITVAKPTLERDLQVTVGEWHPY